jgi:hypothetical protein
MTMSLFDAAKEHPAFSISTAVIVGWLAGIATYKGALEIMRLDTVPHGTVIDRAELEKHQRDLASCEASLERKMPLLQWCRSIAGETLQNSIDAEMTTKELRK